MYIFVYILIGMVIQYVLHNIIIDFKEHYIPKEKHDV
jgi:hypothetical protein